MARSKMNELTPEMIRAVMRELGRRKKTMSAAAIAQRVQAGKKSVESRRRKKTLKKL